MDTWATSSLTPQIAVRLGRRPRPVRAHVPHGPAAPGPRDHPDLALLHGRPLPLRARRRCPGPTPPSRGSSSTPTARSCRSRPATPPTTPTRSSPRYGADARALLGRRRPARAWTWPSSRGQMKIGRKLAIKLLNASKFALGLDADHRRAGSPSRSTGRCWPALADLVAEATSAFDRYDYARALERTEGFFWSFCDDYLELVKNRAYGADGEARPGVGPHRAGPGPAGAARRCSRPFLPFVTEEVWSWWQEGSVHRSPWPSADALREAAEADEPPRPATSPTRQVLAVAAAVLGEVRKAKSEAKRSMRAEVTTAMVDRHPRPAGAAGPGGDDVRRPVASTAGAGRGRRGPRRSPPSWPPSPTPDRRHPAGDRVALRSAAAHVGPSGDGRAARGDRGRPSSPSSPSASSTSWDVPGSRRAQRRGSAASAGAMPASTNASAQPPAQLAHDRELRRGPGLDHQAQGHDLGLDPLDPPAPRAPRGSVPARLRRATARRPRALMSASARSRSVP